MPTTGTLCPDLAANTKYFVVTERTGSFVGEISLNHADSANEDSGSASEWSIEDDGNYIESGVWKLDSGNPRLIEVKGDIDDEIIVQQGWSLTPTGLKGGDKFRLMFVTGTGTRSSNSSDIEDYNSYVRSQAQASNAHTDIKAYNTWFWVLGSTEDVDARDNTATTSSDTDAEIYWLNGSKVADDYADFYDSSWDSETWAKRDGSTSTSTRVVQTGSKNNGTEQFHEGSSRALGASIVRRGRLNGGGNPLDGGISAVPDLSDPYYALSGIFVVPNSDPTGEPTITGTPRVGEVLTADTSDIEDADGLTNPGFEYQWVRVDGDDETDIGTDSSTYTLTEDDAEHSIEVKVSFTDDSSIKEGPISSAETTGPIAPTDLLVRNTQQGQTGSAGLTTAQAKLAQAFTTGANADGYDMDSIGIEFNNIENTSDADDQLTITLNSQVSGAPDAVLCTLSDPATFSGTGFHLFTPPTTGDDLCPTLTASTTYYVVVDRVTVTSDLVELALTSRSNEHAGSAVGWSIADDYQFFSTSLSTWTTVSSSVAQIQVKGDAAAANNAPTGLPTIMGTPRVGEILTRRHVQYPRR